MRCGIDGRTTGVLEIKQKLVHVGRSASFRLRLGGHSAPPCGRFYRFPLTCAGRAVAPAVVGRLRYVGAAEQPVEQGPVLLGRLLAETGGEQTAAGRLLVVAPIAVMKVTVVVVVVVVVRRGSLLRGRTRRLGRQRNLGVHWKRNGRTIVSQRV